MNELRQSDHNFKILELEKRIDTLESIIIQTREELFDGMDILGEMVYKMANLKEKEMIEEMKLQSQKKEN